MATLSTTAVQAIFLPYSLAIFQAGEKMVADVSSSSATGAKDENMEQILAETLTLSSALSRISHQLCYEVSEITGFTRLAKIGPQLSEKNENCSELGMVY